MDAIERNKDWLNRIINREDPRWLQRILERGKLEANKKYLLEQIAKYERMLKMKPNSKFVKRMFKIKLQELKTELEQIQKQNID